MGRFPADLAAPSGCCAYISQRTSSSGGDPMRMRLAVLLLVPATLFSDDRTLEPTWLHRDLSAAREHVTDITTASCHYAPLFGEGDSESRYPLSVSRFGELTI